MELDDLLIFLELVEAELILSVFPPVCKGKDGSMHIRVVGRFKNCIGRDVDLDSAIPVHSDVLQPTDIKDASLSEILSQVHYDLLEVDSSELVHDPHILLRILNKVPQTIRNCLIVKGVIAAMLTALVHLPRTAPHYFPQAYEIGVGELDDFL